MSLLSTGAVRGLAYRWLGGRRRPVGASARERRLLAPALRAGPVGRVLVVGGGLPVRQLLRAQPVDVAGTNPYAAEITVCSSALRPGSLPSGRWDTVVVAETGADPVGRVRATLPACRPGGRVLLVDRSGMAEDSPAIRALRDGTEDAQVVGRRGRLQLWSARVAP